MRVVFQYEKCKTCPFRDKCSAKLVGTKRGIPKRIWYFGEKEILKRRRELNYELLPEERKTLRSNVEATIKEMEKGMNNGKVRLRGKNKVKIYMIFTAMAVNMGRIYRYKTQKGKNKKKTTQKANSSSIFALNSLPSVVMHYAIRRAA